MFRQHLVDMIVISISCWSSTASSEHEVVLDLEEVDGVASLLLMVNGLLGWNEAASI